MVIHNDHIHHEIYPCEWRIDDHHDFVWMADDGMLKMDCWKWMVSIFFRLHPKQKQGWKLRTSSSDRRTEDRSEAPSGTPGWMTWPGLPKLMLMMFGHSTIFGSTPRSPGKMICQWKKRGMQHVNPYQLGDEIHVISLPVSFTSWKTSMRTGSAKVVFQKFSSIIHWSIHVHVLPLKNHQKSIALRNTCRSQATNLWGWTEPCESSSCFPLCSFDSRRSSRLLVKSSFLILKIKNICTTKPTNNLVVLFFCDFFRMF